MSSPSRLQADEEILLRRFVRLTDAYRVIHESEPEPQLAPEQVGENGQITLSGALSGARGAVSALFLESYALLAIYIIWKYCGLFR